MLHLKSLFCPPIVLQFASYISLARLAPQDDELFTTNDSPPKHVIVNFLTELALLFQKIISQQL